MFVLRLYIFSTLIVLIYATFTFDDIISKEPKEIHDLHLLDKLQGILNQSTEAYQKAKEKIETASGVAKQLPDFLNYPHQIIHDAWSKFKNFFKSPEDVIDHFKDSLNTAKDLVKIIDEKLEKLFEILNKTEEITKILQQICLEDIEQLIEDGNEASHPPRGIEHSTKGVSIEVTDEVTEVVTEEITEDLTEEVTKEPTGTIMESINKPVVIVGDFGIAGHKPHHRPHHKPSQPELCNCDICSCEKSCRPSKGEAIQYIPCQFGTVCCIKKPKSGPYSTMDWETVLQLAIDHLHNNLDNME